MHFAMMDAAERECELVARFAAESFRLGKAQMVGVGGLAAADQVRLRRNKLEMLTIAQPAWLRVDDR